MDEKERPKNNTEIEQIWKYDEYQDEDFIDLVQHHYLTPEEMEQVLKLRDIKDYNIFHLDHNTYSLSPDITPQFTRRIEKLEEKLESASEEKEVDRKKVEDEILYLQTMLDIKNSHNQNTCWKINTIFEKRRKEISNAVGDKFGRLYEKRHGPFPSDYDYSEAVDIARKHPELVKSYMPIIDKTGDFTSALDLITKSPHLAISLGSVLTQNHDLLEIYSEYVKYGQFVRIEDYSDEQLIIEERLPARICQSDDPEVIKKHLAEISSLEQELEALLPEGERFQIIANPFNDLSLVVLEKESGPDPYILIKVLANQEPVDPSSGKPDKPLRFEPISLYIYRDGKVISRNGLDNAKYYDRGYLLRQNWQIDEPTFIKALVQNKDQFNTPDFNRILEGDLENEPTQLAKYVLGLG